MLRYVPFFLILLSSCAATPVSYRTADHWSKAEYLNQGSGNKQSTASAYSDSTYEYSAKTQGAASSTSPLEHQKQAEPQGFIARIAPPEPTHAPMQEGKSCLKELRRRKVSFSQLRELKGVDNPVEIHGKLGGVDFWANDGRSFQLDCRLAVALDEVGDVLRSQGVTRIRYSGAYSYRRTRSGRLSHHALGLAIDLHDFEIHGQRLTVSHDFRTNTGCRSGNPQLNELACKLRNEALFEEFLTPDYNSDHRDHLHISVPRIK